MQVRAQCTQEQNVCSITSITSLWNPLLRLWALAMSTLTRNHQNKTIHWLAIKFRGTGSVYDRQQSQCRTDVTDDTLCYDEHTVAWSPRKYLGLSQQTGLYLKSVNQKRPKNWNYDYTDCHQGISSNNSCKDSILPFFLSICVCEELHELGSFYHHPHEAIFHLTD
jgi:hypothetical protein